jgi:hypothetical protein
MMDSNKYRIYFLLFTLALLVLAGGYGSHTECAAQAGSADSLTRPDKAGVAMVMDSTTADSIFPYVATALSDSVYRSYENSVPVRVGFGVGEKLVFSIQYGIVTAGEATLEVRNIAIINDRPCYNIISDARSNKTFSLVFKVRDRYESYMDTTHLYSLRYEKHLREGNFKKDEYVDFDQDNHKAVYKDKVIPIPPRTQDVLSSLYYVRTLSLEIGKSIGVANHTDGKNYPILVKVLRKEQVTVDAGTFDCIVVEPILQSSGVFRHKGKLTVWLTDDIYKMPVLMKSKVMIGSIAAVLKSYTLTDKVN